jgi:hypothetical protein
MPAIKRPLGLALLALAVGLAGAAPAPAAQRRSLVGVNTDRLEYYSPACPTIDAIKTSQKFGSPRNPGDGTAAVDEDGWPTATSASSSPPTSPASPASTSSPATAGPTSPAPGAARPCAT